MDSNIKEKINIPEDLQEICRELGKVAQNRGLTSLSGHFNAPNFHPWYGKISFSWEAGRHNEDSNKIKILIF